MNAAAPRRAVAIGGGTGLPQVLRCLVDLGFETTAVVTMADDGGSSGVLRRQMGILPPGDIRNCLVALAGEDQEPLARVLQYRFAEGEGLAGHALGNLILAALADLTGDFPEAIDIVATHLHARGRVLPSTLEDVSLHGVDREGNEVFGQARLARNDAPVARVHLEPSRPAAHSPALEAIEEADVVVIGPGSLFTSIIPNFLVEGVTAALRRSAAQRVYVCNVANMRGETAGFDAGEYVDALFSHGLEGALDGVLVHDSGCAPAVVCDDASGVEQVVCTERVRASLEARGLLVTSADLADSENPFHHDRGKLSRVLGEVLA